MAGKVRAADIVAVRERAGIAEVIADVVTLRGAGGGNLVGLCPFHDERSPSFNVTPTRGLFYCFGCGEGGDVVAFVMKYDHLSFTEALEKLAGRAGITLQYEDGGATNRATVGNRTRLVAANSRAAAFYVSQLDTPEAAPGREFLLSRGFPAETWPRFGVGWAPKSWDALLNHLRAGGYADAESLQAGLATQRDRGAYDRFRGRLIWPIRDTSGDVLGFGARRILADDDGPKYLNTPETPLYKKSHVLYGIDLARRAIAKERRAVIVEGYTDVMAMHLAGVETAVATCGTAFGDDHAAVLRRFLMDDQVFRGEVVFTFDGDSAGQKAALKAFAGDQRFVSQTFVAVSPDSMDPCELRLARGDAALAELVASRTPLFEFALRSILASHDLGTAEGRVAALREAGPVIGQIRDAALRPEYARLLAGWLGMPEEAVRKAVGSGGGGAHDPRRGGQPGSAPTLDRAGWPHPRDPRLKVEREAIKCVLQAPELVANWYATVEPASYRHPGYAAVHRAVAAADPATAAAGVNWVDAVLAACPNDNVRKLVTELSVEPVVSDGPATAHYATSIVGHLLEDDTTRRLAELTRQVGLLDPVTQTEEVSAMLAEIMEFEHYRREVRALRLGEGA
ncbi:MAG: DNA primase [Candidatus Nanopelagicales bacterium]